MLTADVTMQEKGAGAPSGKDALKSGETPKARGFFTSAWAGSPAGHDKKDSPEQKQGVVTDPDMAPPTKESGKLDTPSSQKTNELVWTLASKTCWVTKQSACFGMEPIAPCHKQHMQ